MFKRRRRQADETPRMANPYETLVTGSPPGVERGLYWDASRGIWRDRSAEASEATRVAAVEADARARQQAREAGQLDGFRHALPNYDSHA